MYLSQTRAFQIRESVAEIKRLAAMKESELPDKTKEEIRLWVRWFDREAEKIIDALDNRKNFQFSPHD